VKEWNQNQDFWFVGIHNEVSAERQRLNFLKDATPDTAFPPGVHFPMRRHIFHELPYGSGFTNHSGTLQTRFSLFYGLCGVLHLHTNHDDVTGIRFQFMSDISEFNQEHCDFVASSVQSIHEEIRAQGVEITYKQGKIDTAEWAKLIKKESTQFSHKYVANEPVDKKKKKSDTPDWESSCYFAINFSQNKETPNDLVTKGSLSLYTAQNRYEQTLEVVLAFELKGKIVRSKVNEEKLVQRHKKRLMTKTQIFGENKH